MRLIGLTGVKRSGKDTLGEWLVAERGFVKYSLATPIKQMLLDLNPFLDGPTSLARFLDKLDGDWEAACADRIHGAEVSHLISAFTEKSLHGAFPQESFTLESVREMLFQLDPRLGGTTLLADVIEHIDELEDIKGHRLWGPETRQLMQRLGTDVMRDMYGSNVWVDHLGARIAHKNVVVTDVRFDNEAAWVKEMDGELYKVVRPLMNQGFGSAHSSEAGVNPQYVTAVVENNGVSLEEFRRTAFQVISNMEDAK